MIKIFVFLFFIGCTATSSNKIKNQFALRSEHKAANSLFQEFFLAPIAGWQNFSFEGQCKRTEQNYYLDWYKLMSSFSFDYLESMEVQRQFNRKVFEKTKNTTLGKVLLKDEHLILATIIDKVKGGGLSLMTPRFERINLIWIDSILREGNNQYIQAFFRKEFLETGYPVLISFCYSSSHLEEFISSHMISNFPGVSIGADSFSIFNKEGQKENFFSLDFTAIFSNEKKLYIYIPKQSSLPKGLKGKFEQIITY